MRAGLYDAVTVANYIIYKENLTEFAPLISNLRLQKLLYFAQVGYLKQYGTPLFKDNIEAWSYGPVVPSVYRVFSWFGSRRIVQTEEERQEWMLIKQADQDFIDKVLRLCHPISTTDLVSISHSHSAWKNAYRNKDKIITKEAMLSQEFAAK